jgi:hypothetical protein
MAWQQVPPQGPGGVGGGYDPRFGQQTGGIPPAAGVNNPFNDVLYGASSGILGTYLGNSKEYVQSNVMFQLSSPSQFYNIHSVCFY